MTAVVFHTFLEMAIGYFCHLARSYLRLGLSSCLSYIFLIYSIFSQTVQSISLISWLRVFCLIVNERSAKDTDEDEIKALLGLLLLAGIFRSNRLNLCDFYNTDGTGVEIFS
ncbi:hypothetical protein T10_9699 [Trichinella papuae]|uniref:PiggyBac transposable element-derived protein domain-containing protein n=1 Tax=Trichinella papuae TaxID=268474 RepID=A0A0V1NAG3_9BILA|nr:hypothetical protein T10_9699 [Trichinella papuae]